MSAKDRAAFAANVKQYACDTIRDYGRFHRLKGSYSELYEFKVGGHRIIGHRDGATLVLTVGAKKVARKAQNADYRRALHLRDNDLQEHSKD